MKKKTIKLKSSKKQEFKNKKIKIITNFKIKADI